MNQKWFIGLISQSKYSLKEKQMTEKPKEVPSTTKPMGALGSERLESSYKKNSPTRDTPFLGKAGGYKNVGKESKSKGNGSEREESAYTKGSPTREEPFQGKKGGYSNVGTKSKSGGDGKEKTEAAYSKKNPFSPK